MSEQRGPFEKSIDLSKVGPPPGRVNPAPKRVEGRHEDNDGIALARMRAALETAANRLDIAASVIRSGAKFARWADEARAALEGRG